jgi:hypothetical protein
MRAYYLHRGESPNLAVQISLVAILFSSLLLLFVLNLCYRRTSFQEGLSKMAAYNLPPRMQNSPAKVPGASIVAAIRNMLKHYY